MASTEDGTMPPSSSDGADCRLRAEIERLRAEAADRMRLAQRRADLWVRVDILLGLPAAFLAGASGAAGLATPDARVPAALLALLAAGLAGCAGSLRSDTRRRANKRARHAWAAVEAGARVRLSQHRVVPADLAELLDRRQAALTAYDAEHPPPGGNPSSGFAPTPPG
ncbi:hypothetical protein GL263_18860 [Streptomyces durbertensis]|uniref:SLATT domain-containing protein n=2 Tax=Streptomyces durbertensis TaxID=2448886 RepID=A0ABR6EK13_9ACTN|nr:hypothetical protein [Streptomyces durbertensis]